MFLYSTVSTLKPDRWDVRGPATETWAKRTDGRDGGDDLAELELVQNSGLAGGIEADHENAHLQSCDGVHCWPRQSIHLSFAEEAL